MTAVLITFYKQLKVETTYQPKSELNRMFGSVKKALSEACESELKHTRLGKTLAMTTDLSFWSAGYAFIIRNKPDWKLQTKRMNNAIVAFGTYIYSFAPLKNSNN